MSEKRSVPFFLAGFERSGTSLLRAVLHQHPALAIPARGEIQYFSRWMDSYGDLADPVRRAAFAEAFFRESKFRFLGVRAEEVLARFDARRPGYKAFFEAVMETYAAAQHKPRWGEKSTTHLFHLEKILMLFPESPIVLIVRDPRDTYLSFVRADWHKDKRFAPAEWAMRWNNAYAKAVDMMDRHPSLFLLYRHEDFIADPQQELSRVLAFLGEDAVPGLLDLSSVDWEQNSSFGDRGREISASSVGRWRHLLREEDVQAIEQQAAPMMNRFGYACATASGKRRTVSWWERFLRRS
jgi:hypothetical protein